MTLKPGSFYWVLPVFCVDTDADHWSQKEQPALHLGHDRWAYIGVDEGEDPWPVRWVGEEIALKSSPPPSPSMNRQLSQLGLQGVMTPHNFSGGENGDYCQVCGHQQYHSIHLQNALAAAHR
jgi:hypothetical protein